MMIMDKGTRGDEKIEWMSMAEVRALLHLTEGSARSYAVKGRIPGAVPLGDGTYRFPREAVLAYQEQVKKYHDARDSKQEGQNGKEKEEKMVTPPTTATQSTTKIQDRSTDETPTLRVVGTTGFPVPVDKDNGVDELLDLLAAARAYCEQHGIAGRIKGVNELDLPGTRFWGVRTNAIELHAVSSPQGVTVLSEEYQRQLEEEVVRLRQQVRELERRLSFLQAKTKEVVLAYGDATLSVYVECKSSGCWVYSPRFSFAAVAQDESEALAVFRRVLPGYTWYLHRHEKELSPRLLGEFKELRTLVKSDLLGEE